MNFIPYGRQTIEQEDIDAVVEVLKSDFLTTGPTVKAFEDAICNYVGSKYAVAVANGTAGLHIVSLALLDKNDKVLTTPNSFLATSNSILYSGATPLFVDIDKNGLIDLDLCEEELKKDASIKTIYVVSFSGHMLEQKKLKYLKDRYNILIVEDCCHSIGAKDGEVKSGACRYSDCSVFSFHPVKHITTGEGGVITTNSESLYKKFIALRGHGVEKNDSMDPWYYEMNALGFNYRLTDMQCALGITQLKKLDKFLEKRVEQAKRYDILLDSEFIKPLYTNDGKSSYHLYVVQFDFEKFNLTKKDLFIKMREKNIGLQVHYIPINKQPYYVSLGYGEEKTPQMDYYYKSSFSIPIFPSLKESEQEYIVDSLKEILLKT